VSHFAPFYPFWHCYCADASLLSDNPRDVFSQSDLGILYQGGGPVYLPQDPLPNLIALLIQSFWGKIPSIRALPPSPRLAFLPGSSGISNPVPCVALTHARRSNDSDNYDSSFFFLNTRPTSRHPPLLSPFFFPFVGRNMSCERGFSTLFPTECSPFLAGNFFWDDRSPFHSMSPLFPLLTLFFQDSVAALQVTGH